MRIRRWLAGIAVASLLAAGCSRSLDNLSFQEPLEALPEGACMVLSATENGYGKCTLIEEYPSKGRGGQGVISIQTSERNGDVVSALLMEGQEEMMLITDGGKLVRTRVEEVSVLGRNTQGVKLISLADGERLVGVGRVLDEE